MDSNRNLARISGRKQQQWLPRQRHCSAQLTPAVGKRLAPSCPPLPREKESARESKSESDSDRESEPSAPPARATIQPSDHMLQIQLYSRRKGLLGPVSRVTKKKKKIELYTHLPLRESYA